MLWFPWNFPFACTWSPHCCNIMFLLLEWEKKLGSGQSVACFRWPSLKRGEFTWLQCVTACVIISDPKLYDTCC